MTNQRLINIDEPCSQALFANIVGISQPSLSRRINDGQMSGSATLAEWLRQYCCSLRDAASGRGESVEKKEKLRLENQIKRLELDRRAGRLIDKERAELGAMKMARTLRDALIDVLPSKIAVELAAATYPWGVECRLRDALRDELKAIVDAPISTRGDCNGAIEDEPGVRRCPLRAASGDLQQAPVQPSVMSVR